MDTILIGLEKIASLVDRCSIYVLLYQSQLLEQSVLRLFTAILKFLANAIQRVNGEDLDTSYDEYH